MVPGAVDGWDELLERFGTMSFAEVLAPAIAYARDGFPVTEIISRDWRGAEDGLARWPDSAATYLPDGRAPRAGEVFRNPDLARKKQEREQAARDGQEPGPDLVPTTLRRAVVREQESETNHQRR